VMRELFLEYERLHSLISQDNCPRLLRGAEDMLQHLFDMPQLGHMPTFSYAEVEEDDNGVSERVYGTKRTPSWPDRILWKGFQNIKLAGASERDVVISDHDPIWGTLVMPSLQGPENEPIIPSAVSNSSVLCSEGLSAEEIFTQTDEESLRMWVGSWDLQGKALTQSEVEAWIQPGVEGYDLLVFGLQQACASKEEALKEASMDTCLDGFTELLKKVLPSQYILTTDLALNQDMTEGSNLWPRSLCDPSTSFTRLRLVIFVREDQHKLAQCAQPIYVQVHPSTDHLLSSKAEGDTRTTSGAVVVWLPELPLCVACVCLTPDGDLDNQLRELDHIEKTLIAEIPMYKEQQMLLLGTLNLPPIVELIENTALVANHNLLLQALFESSDTLYGIMTGTLDRKMGLPTPIEEGVRTIPGLLHGMQDGAVMSIAQKLSHASRTVSAYGSYDGSPQWANRILWRNLDFLQPHFEAVCSDQKQSSLPMRALLSLPGPVRQRDEISSDRLNSGMWAIPRSFLGPEESRMLLESFLSGKERSLPAGGDQEGCRHELNLSAVSAASSR